MYRPKRKDSPMIFKSDSFFERRLNCKSEKCKESLGLKVLAALYVYLILKRLSILRQKLRICY